MKKFIYICILCLSSLSPLEAKKSKDFSSYNLIVKPFHDNIGLFAQVREVMAAQIVKEKYGFKNIIVDFGTIGNYYDPHIGENWWNNYFEASPMQGHATKTHEMTVQEVTEGLNVLRPMPRKECQLILQKCIHIKPFIIDKAEKFYKTHLQGTSVLGVHFRGTDKFDCEAKPITFDQAITAIQKVIYDRKLQDCKIFVATDEQGFLEKMIEVFPHQIVYINAHRSMDGKSVHHSKQDPYELGEEAIIDALLLAKCDVLIRTSSSLSLFSSIYNPDMPVVMLNSSVRGIE